MIPQQEIDIIRKELVLLNKDELLKGLFNPIQKFLVKSNYPLNLDAPTLKGWTELKKIPSKDVLINIIPLLYNDKDIVEGFLKSLPPIEFTLLKKSVWQPVLNKEDLEEIYGRPVLVLHERWENYVEVDLIPDLKRDWSQYITINKPYGFFNNREGLLANSKVKFSLPTVIRKLLSLQLPKPTGYDFHPLEHIPEGCEVYNWENDIFRLFPSVLSFVMNGKIKFSQKGYANASSLGKMSKSLKVEEFSAADPYFIRSRMLVGFIGHKFKVESINTPVLQSLQTLFSADMKLKNTAPFLLPHLKGINYFSSYQFNLSITPKIMNVFKQLPKKEWISFENLKTYVTSRFINLIPSTSWEFMHKVVVEHEMEIDGMLEEIQTDLNEVNMNEFVAIPHLAAHVYFMASWGLMEIAVKPERINYSSPYDPLMAFRITGLGEYILGLSSQYTPPENEIKTALSFDEKSLFIRVEGDINLGDTMLNKFANKVSENRYQFSAGKFLKDVTNTKNLINKIDLFKQTIGQKLPPNWEDYLQQLIKNSNQLKSRSNVVVFTLPPANREMHIQVAQDELLRKIAIKAEKYQIIVDKKDIPAFTQRMKELGYLIDHYLLL